MVLVILVAFAQESTHRMARLPMPGIEGGFHLIWRANIQNALSFANALHQ